MSHQGQLGVYFESLGYRLLGTLFLAQGDEPKPTAVILHGLPGIEKNYDLALFLREHGWNSLIFHYRGCWGSAGVYNLKTILKDVQAALDYLCSGKHMQIEVNKLVLIGHSLGGWAAVLVSALDQRVKATAVYGAISDPRNIKWKPEIIETDILPWLPGLNLESFMSQWDELGAEFTPVEQVTKIAPRPLLIIHAAEDELVSAEHAIKLYAPAARHSKLIIHPEANHAFTWHREWLRSCIFEWLENL